MFLEVTRKIESVETVLIELPYYYQRRINTDGSIIYGRIDKTYHHSIQLTKDDSAENVCLVREPTDWDYLSPYLDEEFRATADDYCRARHYALQMIENM